jgi:hypothetical protein
MHYHAWLFESSGNSLIQLIQQLLVLDREMKL